MIELLATPNQLVKRLNPARGVLDDWFFLDTLLRDGDPGRSCMIPYGSSLYVRGWALLPEPPRTARGVVVIIGQDVWFETIYARSRPDVAKALDDYNLIGCGFVGIRKLTGLALGPHEFIVGALDEENGLYELARRQFELVPSNQLLQGKTRGAYGRMQIQLDDIAMMRRPNAYDGKTLRSRVGDVVYVRGWAVDTETRTGLGGVVGIFDGDEHMLGVHGLPRDDVAASMALQDVRYSGFTLRMPTQQIEPGAHSLEVAVISADGSTYEIRHVAKLELSSR